MRLTFLAKGFMQRDSATICRISCRIPLAKLSLITDEEKYNLAKKFKAKVTPDGNIEFTCHGVARCCVDDSEKYDYTLGCHIAESKAKQKAYSKAERILYYYQEKAYRLHNTLKCSVERLRTLSTYELAHIEELIG